MHLCVCVFKAAHLYFVCSCAIQLYCCYTSVIALRLCASSLYGPYDPSHLVAVVGTVKTVAAVCNTLPMDVLLGTDVVELDKLLRNTEKRVQKGTLALIATTRSRARKEAEEEMHRLKKQPVFVVHPNSLEQKENDVWDMGTKLDDLVFHGKREKVFASRRQKCEERRKYAAQVCPDSLQCSSHRLQEMSIEDLKTLQEADPGLKAIKEGAEHERSVNGVSFVRKEGI